MPREEHVKLMFKPTIWLTSERTAQFLGISVEKADKLLSGPDTYNIVKEALQQGLDKALDEIIRLLARQGFPKEAIPIRQDCNVSITGVEARGVFEL